VWSVFKSDRYFLCTAAAGSGGVFQPLAVENQKSLVDSGCKLLEKLPLEGM